MQGVLMTANLTALTAQYGGMGPLVRCCVCAQQGSSVAATLSPVTWKACLMFIYQDFKACPLDW